MHQNFASQQQITPLRINPQAHNLIFRLCFLQTIGCVSGAEILQAMPQIFPYNPSDFLFKEFKLDRLAPTENPKKIIRDKITNFTKSHSFNEAERVCFVQNLVKIMQVQRLDLQHLSAVPQYQEMYRVVGEIEQEICTKKPSLAINSDPKSALNLSKVETQILVP